MKLNMNLEGTQITDEIKNDVGSGTFLLDHDTFFSGEDFEVWTGPGKTGTQLIQNGDYVLELEDTRLSGLCQRPVYTAVRVITPTYQQGQLYITYKTIGDYNDATILNSILAAAEERKAVFLDPAMAPSWPWLASYHREYNEVLLEDENDCTSLAFDGKNILAGLYTTPAKVVKIDPDTGARIAGLTLSAGENRCRCLISDGFYFYAGLDTNPAKIVKIKPENMGKEATLTLNDLENDCQRLAYDGTYLYAFLGTSPTKVIRIDPVTMTRVQSLTLSSGYNVSDAFFNGQFIYCLLDDTKIVKINPDTFTEVASCTTPESVAGITSASGIIYAANSDYMYKIDPSTMTLMPSVPLSGSGGPHRIIYVNGLIYLIGEYIRKYSPITDKTHYSFGTYGLGPTTVNAVTFDGISLYIGTNDSPARIIQLGIVNI